MLKTFFAVLCFLVLSFSALSQTKKSVVTVDEIEKGMLHLISGKMPKRYRIGPNKRNAIIRSPEHRKELAEAIHFASKKYNLKNPFWLVAISFREGSFQRVVVADSEIGERSTFQISPKTEKWIAKELDEECTTKTYQGAAICAAALLDQYMKKCGTIEGALTKYATGKRFKPYLWSSKDRASMAFYLLDYIIKTRIIEQN